ncbi:MAG: glycoside hydrolase family 16 protein, partial [Paludibacteraceae bacterium]|nr:glycoside hydrolase family 16 protein [Paludibacteraceae bacterium]
MKNRRFIWITSLFIIISSLAHAQYDGYTLVWSDEFNGGYTNADYRTGLDMDSWSFETGGGGWGTGQRDVATADPENVQVSNGTLKIRTHRHNANQTDEYTSGRINSQNKRSFLYGKMEAKIRTDNMTQPGRGFAFWMLGEGIPAGKANSAWPQTGEIDIMEYNGLYPDYNLGSCHYAYNWNNFEYGGEWNHGQASGIYYESNRKTKFNAPNHYDGCTGYASQGTSQDNRLGDSWHIYGINWYADRIEFYIRKENDTVEDVYAIFRIDRNQWCPVHSDNAKGNVQSMTGYPTTQFSENWRPFENPFYFVLSAGVGGANTYGGNITNGTNPDQWTCTTEIDWVRVYKLNSA